MRSLYYRGRLDGAYSVAEVFRVLLRGLLRAGVDCAVFPDDRQDAGFIHQELKRALLAAPLTEAKLALTGAAPAEWHTHLKGQLRAVIMNFESQRTLPLLMQMPLMIPDLFLPSSKYSDDALALNGVPAAQRVILPHAIDDRYGNSFDAPRHGPFVVTVVASNHARKNVALCIDAFRAAFADQDVRLKLRVPGRRATPLHFEVDITIPSDPRIEWIREPQVDLSTLLAESHVVFSLSAGEGFGLPLLEGLAAGALVVCPRYSGQLDFLHDENALLIDTKERITPINAQYVPPELADKNARDGEPSFDHAVALLQRSRAEWASLRARFREGALHAAARHTPARIAEELIVIARRFGVELRDG